MKKLSLLVTVFLCSIFLSASAYAVPITNYTLNYSAASGTLAGANISDVNNVDEMGFQGARTVVGFNDIDGDDDISKGDTFDDFFAISIDSFKDSSGNNLFPAGYGNDYQLTLLGQLTGVQTTDNTFAITSIEDLGLFFDAGDDYTQSSTADISTFSDGTRVETGDLVLGGGTNDAGIISGTFDLVVDIEDLLHTTSGSGGEHFEIDEQGDPFPMNLTFGLVDSNTDGSTNFPTTAFENDTTFFNFDTANYDFVRTAINDGSINKTVVPEPTTMLLFGTGLLGLAAFARRKQRKL